MLSTEAMLTLLQEVAEEVITPRFRALADDEIHTKTHAQDFVTAADQEAEVLITRELRAAYPGAVVLGEEAFAQDASLLEAFRDADHAFTVDPVDGTKNFVHGSPDHAVMVAETRGGETVRSWIWQPQHGLAYVAELGSGVERNGEPLPALAVVDDAAVWRVRSSDPHRVGTSLGPTAPMELTWVSCGIDYPKLLEGACDALVYRGTRPWDHVPGSLMVHELGGVVGSVDGRVYAPREDPRGLLATASPQVYAVLQPYLA